MRRGFNDGQPLPRPSTARIATVGIFSQFCPDTVNFEVCLERFNLLIKVNGVNERKKLKIFSTTLGDKAYVALRRLLLLKAPKNAKLDEVVVTLWKHYARKDGWLRNTAEFTSGIKGAVTVYETLSWP